MPYDINNPPEQIKDLPRHAQEIWIKAFNSALDQYDNDEAKASAVAWAAVKKAGYAKDEESGKWRKVDTAGEDKQPVETFAMTDEEKRAFTAALKRDDMNGLVATHRRLHMWASKGNVLSGASKQDMIWMHNQVVEELKRRWEKDPKNKGKKYPQHDTPLKYEEDPATEIEYDEAETVDFCAASSVWSKMKKRAKKKKKASEHSEDAEEFKEIEDVEIFEAGYHKGKFYSLDYLDKLVENFKALRDKVKPPVKLGHGSQDLLHREGLPAGGWVTDVKRVGRKLVATLSEVPEKVYKAIKKGAYKRISSEIYPEFRFGGKNFGPVLKAIALLGADIPEIKTLSDVLALDDDQVSIWLNSQADRKGGEGKVAKFTEEELKLLIEEKVEEETQKFREELAKAKREKAAAEKRIKELEERQRKEKIESFVERLRSEGLAPAVIDDLAVGEFCERLDSSEVIEFSDELQLSALDYFIKFAEEVVKRAKEGKLIVPQGELAPGAKHKAFGEGEDEEEKAKELASYVNPAKADK